MKILRKLDRGIVETVELDQNSTLRLGSCGLDHEFEYFQGEYEPDDLRRAYLLWTFERATINQTGLAVDTIRMFLEPRSRFRLALFRGRNWDLRGDETQSPIVIAPDAHRGPFIAIDGNHRQIYQATRYGTVEGMRPIVCVHPEILSWNYIPRHARGAV